VTGFLIDEMFPLTAAVLLRDNYRRDAVHVSEIGLLATEDTQIAAAARAQRRALITENVADFATERDVVLAFILEKNLPAGGAQAPALAKALDRWARANPDPYVGPHWPEA
jgi:hypothetical protein